MPATAPTVLRVPLRCRCRIHIHAARPKSFHDRCCEAFDSETPVFAPALRSAMFLRRARAKPSPRARATKGAPPAGGRDHRERHRRKLATYARSRRWQCALGPVRNRRPRLAEPQSVAVVGLHLMSMECRSVRKSRAFLNLRRARWRIQGCHLLTSRSGSPAASSPQPAPRAPPSPTFALQRA